MQHTYTHTCMSVLVTSLSLGNVSDTLNLKVVVYLGLWSQRILSVVS